MIDKFEGMVEGVVEGSFSRLFKSKLTLAELQKRDPSAPLARLGSQLYDQYGMTGQLRGACAQLLPRPCLFSRAGRAGLGRNSSSAYPEAQTSITP